MESLKIPQSCIYLGNKSNKEERMTIESQSVSAKIENSIMSLTITQVYKNALTTPVEAVYCLPQPSDSSLFLGGLQITIDERTIDGKVMQKDKAKEKYEDALASGKAVVLVQEQKDDNLEINVGNILPAQTI